MKLLFCGLFFTLLTLLAGSASGQAPNGLNRLRRVDEGLYFMYYDSSASKSTVVEFSKFLVLLEVPIADQGGGARNLRDHQAGGRRALATLTHHFPGKPLRYVVHSHWHPHSLSAVEPFLAAGCTLVSTKANFGVIRQFVDSAIVRAAGERIQLIDTDSLVIADRHQRLVAYRFTQQQYPSTPTADYLFCRLPRYGLLHCGCMFNRWEGAPIAGRELLTSREEDLNRFLLDRKLHPQGLIRLNVESKEPTDIQPMAALQHVVQNGIRSTDLQRPYLRLSPATLTARRDSLVAGALADHLPSSLLNSAIFSALAAQQLEKALGLAHLQVQLAPAAPNAWDTLGEAYYFLNRRELASHYAQQAKRLDPTGAAGDESVWAKDLAEHEQKWRTATAKP